MRSFLVVMLVVLGGLLTIPGSIGIWQERAILDEDAFVDTVDEAFEQKEEVQSVLANRLTDAVMEHLEIRDRIGEGLAELESRGGDRTPEGLVLLEGPLTGVARDAVFRVALRLIDEHEEAREAALRGVHRTLVAIVDEDVEFLTERGHEITLDLGIIVEELVRDIGGERADEFLETVELLDAAVIVLTDKSDGSTLFDVMHFLDRYYPVLAGVALVLFAIAVIVSRNRRLTLIWVGATLAVVAAAEILAVALPLKEVLTDTVAKPDGKAAAKATYDILYDSFERQELFVILIGVGLVAGGTLTGESELARAVRSVFRRPQGGLDEEISLGGWVRKRALALRIGGLALGGLFLIGWPDPSTRLTVTGLIVVALYLTLIAIVSSEAAWAGAIRSPVVDFWNRYFHVDDRAVARAEGGRRSLLEWLAVRAPRIRLIGLVIGVVFLIVLPDVTLGTVVIVLALEMLLFAAVDFLTTRAGQR